MTRACICAVFASRRAVGTARGGSEVYSECTRRRRERLGRRDCLANVNTGSSSRRAENHRYRRDVLSVQISSLLLPPKAQNFFIKVQELCNSELYGESLFRLSWILIQ